MTLLAFENIPIKDNGEPLLDLAHYPFVLEPAYFQLGLSTDPRLFSRKTIADKLLAIQESFADGTRFKIWDAWRPRTVQNTIFQRYWIKITAAHPDWSEALVRRKVEKFVTRAEDPSRIPPHASGGAIDLTLVNASGKELPMGTVFDHFGAAAASLYFEKPESDKRIRDNRRMLREAMIAHEFRFDEDEWWHFDYGNQLWAAALNKPFAIYGEIESIG